MRDRCKGLQILAGERQSVVAFRSGFTRIIVMGCYEFSGIRQYPNLHSK